ncbi:MAG: MFS transporter [Verrucomicrobiota bacterium]
MGQHARSRLYPGFALPQNLAVAVPCCRTHLGSLAGADRRRRQLEHDRLRRRQISFGPVIDRLGGRFCFFASLVLVAIFGAAGGLAGSVPMLVWWYSCNRLAGSAAWGSMMKLIPDWFSPRDLAFASALLSLGFVFGGVCATLLAGQIAAWSSNNWRVVMAAPSAVLLAIVVFSWLVLPRKSRAANGLDSRGKTGIDWQQFLSLLKIRQFWIVCGLSFTLTLMRETFNTWTVDFFRTGDNVSEQMALSRIRRLTPSVLWGSSLGWATGRLGQWVAAIFFVGFCLIADPSSVLPAHHCPAGPWLPTIAVAIIAFSAWAIQLARRRLVRQRSGQKYVRTVAGIVDGVGYLAGILAGQQFERIVDAGGYTVGFQSLAILTLIAAVLCLFLYPKERPGRSEA